MENLYKGYHPKDGEEVKVVEFPQDAKEFYKNFVASRTPVVIKAGKEFVLNPELWTLEKLREKAGNVILQIESKEKGQFGLANQRLTLSLDAMIKRFEQGDTSLYLTTQYDEHEVDGETRELSGLQQWAQPPLDTLLDSFPERPPFLDTLIPQQVNLWMGCTKEPTSSGLHHDFADNLYVVVQGTKRFTLFSPKLAEDMKLSGKALKVWENGLICYKEGVRGDGARQGDVDEWQWAVWDEEYDRLQDKESLSKEEEERVKWLREKLGEAVGGIEALRDDSDEDEPGFGLMEEGEDSEDSEDSEGGRKRVKVAAQLPPSFSTITLKELHDENFKLPKMIATLTKGDMLYLPASWFHEVTSKGEGDTPVHIAFNYWMHPPVTQDYEKPYEDGYWEQQWIELVSASSVEDEDSD